MKHTFFILSLFIWTLYGCNAISEPTLKTVADAQLVEMNKDRLILNTVMVYDNPNSFSLDLDQADLVAYIDDIEVAVIKQNYNTSMPANAEFEMPINIKMDLKKLYSDNKLKAIQKGLEIASKRELELKFLGSIKIGKGSTMIQVPVNTVEIIKFK